LPAKPFSAFSRRRRLRSASAHSHALTAAAPFSVAASMSRAVMTTVQSRKRQVARSPRFSGGALYDPNSSFSLLALASGVRFPYPRRRRSRPGPSLPASASMSVSAHACNWGEPTRAFPPMGPRDHARTHFLLSLRAFSRTERMHRTWMLGDLRRRQQPTPLRLGRGE
jgi:hypothetical protein